MTQEQFKERLDEMDIPVFYDHAKAGTKVPFITYNWHRNSQLNADDKVYTKKNEVTIELITNSKSDLNRLSEKLEDILEDIAPWTSEEGYSDEEQIYNNYYTMEV